MNRISYRKLRCAFLSTLFTLSATACQDLTAKLPAGTVDPSSYNTRESILMMANNARYTFQAQYRDFVWQSGLVTDELFAPMYGRPLGPGDIPINWDSREFASGVTGIYSQLHNVRRMTLQARESLGKYGSDLPSSLRGEMYALEAWTETILADIFCSGIPLTTVDFEGDFTYREGSTTAQVYAHAAALFDTAISLSRDSARVNTLARIGKARALLALGQYSDADTTISSLPFDSRYALPIVMPGTIAWAIQWRNNWGSVSNREAGSGLPFREDPRVQWTQTTSNTYGVIRYTPAVRTWWEVATGLEARLIQAEAALQAGRAEWLDILNELRTDGNWNNIVATVVYDTIDTEPALVIDTVLHSDTAWNAGLGGVNRLGRINDPDIGATGPTPSRVDILFRERAMWLYLRATRQGDLRRLIRHYDRSVSDVYPMGPYSGGLGYYADNVEIEITNEEDRNPYYSGCVERGA